MFVILVFTYEKKDKDTLLLNGVQNSLKVNYPIISPLPFYYYFDLD